ncbi:FliA/WhiG family RNA polymerase sigma factor [Desulfovibrio inopinatus]|uniref:FliA/WhiG family RNA polymerase sigma factor n=1 Tax=Desulfovibrio inopinatus TaxID=102109 RepID=UPI000487E28D|nr:FliA/WhiG family RNA polymerase sigma factor [Desulfovibrio inopinatus]
MATLNSSGKSSSSKSSPWSKLESGETPWEEFDLRQRQEIVAHYSPKIKILALRLKSKLPQSIELNELISAGALGLMEALGRFNPELGIKFETYAENRIKGAMLDDLRRMDWFSRSLRQRIRTLEEAIRTIENKNQGPPNIEKLSELTGFSEKEVTEGLEALQNQLCVSLDSITENVSSFKKGQGDNEPYTYAAFKELVEKLAHLIDELTPREKLVLSLYYGEELNMRETSEVMGITEGRVSQLHSQALSKLKAKFQAQHGISST